MSLASFSSHVPIGCPHDLLSSTSFNVHKYTPGIIVQVWNILEIHCSSSTETSLFPRGARSLGWNMSQALAEAGAKAIALLDVKDDLGDPAAAELHQSTGIPVQFYKIDVRDEKAIAEVVSKISSDLGSVDIVINSAGVVE